MRSVRTGSTAAAARRDETRLRELDRVGRLQDVDENANRPRGLVARGRRAAGTIYPLAGATTRSVMAVAGPVLAGRSYRIDAQFYAWVDGAAASYGDLFLNYSLDDSVPAVGINAQLLDHGVIGIPTGGAIPYPLVMSQTLVPAAAGVLRVLMSARMGEAGRNYGLYSDAAAGITPRIWITDEGADPGESSTDY